MAGSEISSIAPLLHGFSIEINTTDPRAAEAAQRRLLPGTLVFLTWIAGTDPSALVGPSTALRRAGLIPVPHICARHLQSSRQLRELAERLAGDAGVDRVLLLGGDDPQPAGSFDSSMAVLQSGILQQAGIRQFYFAGFPEGNPHIPDEVLAQALADKLAFARQDGLQASIVTQFCFSSSAVAEWLQKIRSQGIGVPVRVGLAGPVGLITLTRYAIKCGVGNSIRVLTENPAFAKLLATSSPEPLIRDLALAAEEGLNTGAALDLAGLHFFVFGGFDKTVDWIAQRVDQASQSALHMQAAG